MISKFFKLLIALTAFFSINLQAQDTLWVKRIEGKPYVVHKVNAGEDIFLLAKKYSVPPAALADANNMNYQSGLERGSKIWIPVDNYNFIRVESVVKSKPIYYKTVIGDELNDVSRLSHVSQSTIQRWNHLNTPDIHSGQILQIGWISFDSSQIPFAAKNKTEVIPAAPQPNTKVSNVPAVKNAAVSKAPAGSTNAVADTSKTGAKNVYEDLYNQQVEYQTANNESGAAVFYPLKIKTAEGVYYAFHNTAPKGTIIKVTNPSNGNVIFAKVIGAIPNLPDYNNAVIALSTNAAKGLMAKERRMFCKIEYR